MFNRPSRGRGPGAVPLPPRAAIRKRPPLVGLVAVVVLVLCVAFWRLHFPPIGASTRPASIAPAAGLTTPGPALSLSLPSNPVHALSLIGNNSTSWYLFAASGDLWETDGSQSVQLTRVGDLSEPALTPRGLVYIQRQKNYSDLWLVNAERTPTRLTQDSSTIIDQNHWVFQPVVIPGTNQLYVISDHSKASTGVGDLAIWSLDLARGIFKQVTNPPAYTGGDQDLTVNPVRPNEVVFTRYVYDASGQLAEQLNWLDVTQRIATALTTPGHPSRQAAFAPDGSHLAFVQTNGAEEDLYVGEVQVSQGTPQLANLQQVASGVNAQPAWSADGSSLSYISLQNRQFQLWSVAITTQSSGSLTFSSPTQLTRGPSIDATSRPFWLSAADANQIQSWLQTATIAAN